METATIVKLLIVGGIGLNVVSIGVRAKPQDALAMVRKHELGVRAMLAMFLFVPGFVFLITMFFPMSRPVTAVLLALSVAPMLPPCWAWPGFSG